MIPNPALLAFLAPETRRLIEGGQRLMALIDSGVASLSVYRAACKCHVEVKLTYDYPGETVELSAMGANVTDALKTLIQHAPVLQDG